MFSSHAALIKLFQFKIFTLSNSHCKRSFTFISRIYSPLQKY